MTTDKSQHGVIDQLPTTLIDGMRHEAEHAADLLIDTLEERGLIPPEKQRRRCPGMSLCLGGAVRAAAALRRREWNDQRLSEFVVDNPPESDFELQLDGVFQPQPPSEWAKSRQYAVRTLVAWIRSFAWSARGILGVDVALSTDRPLTDHELDGLAEFVWRNRHIQRENQGANHGHT